MAFSPRLGWPVPEEFSDPWIDAFESFSSAIDATSYSYREDRNTILMGGGTISFNGASLSWSQAIELFSPVTGFIWSIPAGLVQLNDGQLLYTTLVRYPSTNTAVAVSVSFQIPSSDDTYIIAIRRDDRVYFRNGDVIQD